MRLTSDDSGKSRQDQRLAAYARLRRQRPALFHNPADAAIVIAQSHDEQETVAAEVRAAMVKRGLPAEYADVGVLYEDSYILLLRDAVRFPGGRLGSFIRIVPVGPDGAVVLPIADGRILLLRHFRHATRKWHWEAPRGFGEPGEEPGQTARRELNEECSLTVTALHELGRITSDAGISSTSIHLFAAETDGTMSLDSAEAISAARWLTIRDIESWIRDETIDDALTISAIARARARGLL